MMPRRISARIPVCQHPRPRHSFFRTLVRIKGSPDASRGAVRALVASICLPALGRWWTHQTL
ncbi:hypothetical protein C2E23DRAFT_812942 [Lenzites betulinus]|nr:hypothetical protein C2E23DRAFT_812942 [Lenzites betulinus]